MDADSPAAWHADPLGRYPHRWWDGSRWTDQVAHVDGSVGVDPRGIAASSDLTALGPAPSPSAVAPPSAPLPMQPGHPGLQTPGFNLPGGGAWAAPQQVVVANASKSPGLAVASMILGIGAFFFALIPFVGFLSIPFALVGLGLGISGAVRASKGYEGKGMSIAGIVTCVAALLISGLYLFAIGSAAGDSDGVNSDPVDGICNPNRFIQDPDC